MDNQDSIKLNNHSNTHAQLTYIQNCLAEVEKQCEMLDMMRQDVESKLEEWNKDDEIIRLQERIVRLSRRYSEGFNPSEEQWKKINKWQNDHIRKKHKPQPVKERMLKYNPNDVSFSYEFGYTPLGVMGNVVCNKCRDTAFKRSFGNKELYRKIMKAKNAEYFMGEV